MKLRRILPALLTAAWLLCACAPSDPAPSSAGSDNSTPPAVSTSQPQVDTSQDETTYTETDVQAAFNRSDSAQNSTILDCVVADDQAYELIGVVQYLTPDYPDSCMLGFVSLNGVVQSSGPQATPADDDSLTYLGNGVVSMNMIQEESGEPYQYKLSFSRNGTEIAYRSWDSLSQTPDPFL